MFTSTSNRNTTQGNAGKGKSRHGGSDQSTKTQEVNSTFSGKGKQAKSEIKLVTPEFRVLGQNPNIMIHGSKELGESFGFAVFVPGSNIPDMITMHRPIGVTPFDRTCWIGTRASAIPNLLVEGAKDLKDFNNLLRTLAEEAVIGQGSMVIRTPEGGTKQEVVYGPEVLSAMHASIGFGQTAADATMRQKIIQDEKSGDCPVHTNAIFERIRMLLATDPICSRNLIKKTVEGYLDEDRKASPEYEEYVANLKLYSQLTKHEKNRTKQPVQPAASRAWTHYVPQALRDVEIMRDRFSRELAAGTMASALAAGTIRPTTDPFSRNEQISIEQFKGLSINEIQGRLFGFFHFGENLEGGRKTVGLPPPAQAPK